MGESAMAKCHSGYVSHYLTSGEPRVIGTRGREVEGRCKDGTVIPILLTLMQDKDNDFIAMFNDLTDQVHADILTKANSRIIKWAAQITHDFGTLISSMKMAIEVKSIDSDDIVMECLN